MPPRKKYTIFLVLYETDKPVKKIPIKNSYLRVGVGIGVFILFAFLFLGFLIYDDIKLRSKMAEFDAIKFQLEENERWKIDKLGKIATINRKHKRLEKYITKIRMMANIEQPSQANRVLNVGGSREYTTELYAALEKGDDHITGLMEEQLDVLDRSVSLEESRAVEIEEYLKDQQSFLASVPSVWPVRGWLSSGFGYRISPFTGAWQMHEGIDVATQEGRPIIAPAEGIVTKVSWNGGFGKILVIEHGYGYKTKYAHLSKVTVKKGDKIKRGAEVAEVGNTGRSTGPHLHYEVLLNNVPVNPLNFILN